MGIAKLMKYAFVTVIGLVFLAVLVIGFGEFFIPLLMVAVIAAFWIITGTAKSWWAPLWLALAFLMTWGVQKLNVYALSTFEMNISDNVLMLYCGLFSAFIVGIVLLILISMTTKVTISTSRKR